jgi:ATP-dependent DNA helicase RecQ
MMTMFNPKNKSRNQLVKLLEVVYDTKHLYKSRSCFYAYCVNAVIKAHRTDTIVFFVWNMMKILMALLRQVL